ncbi:MAG: hypothetical protein HKN36_09055 [Hellea sp.]|nr:hypothetical protein [Hellea sp.]
MNIRLFAFAVFFAIAAVIGIGISLSTSLPAFAQSVDTSPQDLSNVKRVNFYSGSFARTSDNSWDEFDRFGSYRFSFQEVRRGASSLYLRNDQHDVDIELNLRDNKIYGKWPGHQRHLMHDISSAEFEPKLEIVHPTPMLVTPPQTSTHNMRFSSIDYDGGTLKDEGKNFTDWQNGSDAIHIYQTLGRDDRGIYLYDDSKRRLIKIDVADQKIHHAIDGGPLTFHAKITSMAAVSANPPTIGPRAGTMSFEDREMCIWSGGRVERAGMMGAERCTRAYSDGGNSCTDSTQCQGMCRTDTSQSNNSAAGLVRGVCQKDDNPFGCHSEVKNGRAEVGLCVD